MQTSRRAALALLSGTGAIRLLCGADAWTKDPASWDEKDIAKMLSDSPWAQRVDVALGSGAGGRGMRGGDGGISDDPTGQLSGPGGGPGGMGGSGGGRRGGGMGGGEGVRSMTFTVRWMSALRLKQAVVRLRMGKEAEAPAQAKEYLERTETHYIVALLGPARGPGMGGGADATSSDRMQRLTAQLKETTGLLRKGKQPIRPETVQVSQAGQNNYLFLFPRMEPITLDDKDVEFATRLGPLEVKRKFKLKDMVYQGRLEL